MNLKKENRSGSKWRRSLMALAILSAPVVSIAGFSGTASAAISIGTPTTGCSAVNDGFITVNFIVTESSTAVYSVYIRPTSANPWPADNTTFRAVFNKQNTDAEFSTINSYGQGSGAVTITEGVFDVKVVPGNGNSNVTVGTQTFVVNVFCRPITFPTALDQFVSYTCLTPTSATVTVTMPSRDPSTAQGPPYSLTVTPGSLSVISGLNQDETTTFNLSPGTYNFAFTSTGAITDSFSRSYIIDCTPDSSTTSTTIAPGGGYNFTFNLPKVTTAPVLPSTGSDSSTSLLVIAPMMVLLGAGLILARRRTSTV